MDYRHITAIKPNRGYRSKGYYVGAPYLSVSQELSHRGDILLGCSQFALGVHVIGYELIFYSREHI